MDFLVLAKVELHKAFFSQQLLGKSDNIIPDLHNSLVTSLGEDSYNKIQQLAIQYIERINANKK